MGVTGRVVQKIRIGLSSLKRIFDLSHVYEHWHQGRGQQVQRGGMQPVTVGGC